MDRPDLRNALLIVAASISVVAGSYWTGVPIVLFSARVAFLMLVGALLLQAVSHIRDRNSGSAALGSSPSLVAAQKSTIAAATAASLLASVTAAVLPSYKRKATQAPHVGNAADDRDMRAAAAAKRARALSIPEVLISPSASMSPEKDAASIHSSPKTEDLAFAQYSGEELVSSIPSDSDTPAITISTESPVSCPVTTHVPNLASDYVSSESMIVRVGSDKAFSIENPASSSLTPTGTPYSDPASGSASASVSASDLASATLIASASVSAVSASEVVQSEVAGAEAAGLSCSSRSGIPGMLAARQRAQEAQALAAEKHRQQEQARDASRRAARAVVLQASADLVERREAEEAHQRAHPSLDLLLRMDVARRAAYESTRSRLIAEQDAAYLEALTVDQERSQRVAVQEARARVAARAQQEAETLRRKVDLNVVTTFVTQWRILRSRLQPEPALGPGTVAVAVKLPSGFTPRRRFLSDVATLRDLYTWVSFELHEDIMSEGTAASTEARRTRRLQRESGSTAEAGISSADGESSNSEQVVATVSLTAAAAVAIRALHEDRDAARLYESSINYVLVQMHTRQILACTVEAGSLTLAEAGMRDQVVLVIESTNA